MGEKKVDIMVIPMKPKEQQMIGRSGGKSRFSGGQFFGGSKNG